MQIDANWQLISGAALLACATAVGVWQSLRGRVPSWHRQPAPVAHSSDARPPEGFASHVAVIVSAAPTATPQVVLGYLQAGLTEAETLRAEVKRMGGAA